MKKITMGSMAVLTALSVGCVDASDDDAGVGGEGGMSASAPPDPYENLYTCAEGNFGDVHPLSGPGFDPAKGIAPPADATYVVTATMLYWKEEKTTDFYQMGGRVMAQLNDTKGLLAYALATDETCLSAYSISIWQSEEDLYDFVLSGAHAEAVGMALDLSYTGKGTIWQATGAELDSLNWETAKAKLEEASVNRVYQ